MFLLLNKWGLLECVWLENAFPLTVHYKQGETRAHRKLIFVNEHRNFWIASFLFSPAVNRPLAPCQFCSCVSTACTHSQIQTRADRQEEVNAPISPGGPWAFYSSCPVLTELEVAGWLHCIVGQMNLPEDNTCMAKSWEGREGQGKRNTA